MAESLWNQVAIMNHGKLIANQSTAELLSLFRQEFYRIRNLSTKRSTHGYGRRTHARFKNDSRWQS